MKSRHHKDNSNLWVAVISITLTVVVIIVLAWTQKNEVAGAGNSAASRLETPEVFYDFGVVSMADGKVTKIFIAKNNTAQTIAAKKLYTSCMCTQATLILNGKEFGPFGMPAHGAIPEINQNIEPGQEIQIRAVFDPAAHGPAGVGPIERQVILETDEGQAIFKFKAQVTP